MARVPDVRYSDARYPRTRRPHAVVGYPTPDIRAQGNCTLGRHELGRRGEKASTIGASRPGEGQEICLKGVSSPDTLLVRGCPSLIYP